MSFFEPKIGDLFFQEIQETELDKNISAVAIARSEISVNHVGIFSIEDQNPVIWEAFPPKVNYLPQGDFLSRSLNDQQKPLTLVGRLKKDYQSLIPAALDWIKTCRNTPYNFSFLPDQHSFYCSELIINAFEKSAHKPFFPLTPMSFKDIQTGLPLIFWQEYYQKLQIPVPEGVLGSHPAQLFTSHLIEIIFDYRL